MEHRGKPRKYDELVPFGMKITKADRKKIADLAAFYGKSAKRAIMDLVDKEIKNIDEKYREVKRISIEELVAMPVEERKKTLRKLAEKAAKMYRDDPNLIMDGYEDIIEY